MKIKPQLAEDAILDKVIFPRLVQPKVDGVRAMNLDGTLTGRSLDPFPGFGITEYFSDPRFLGFDGEMALGADPQAPGLCSDTTGAMGRFKGVTEMADLHWWVFDYITPETATLPYHMRYLLLSQRVHQINHPRIHLMPQINCYTAADLDRAIAANAAANYEGTIIRNPNALYKEGRATKKVQELWRVKPWGDFEILVTGITEGQRNENEAKKNTLGRTERSSAQSGMVPNGQVGSIQGTLVKDLIVNGGSLVIPAGTLITAGSGKMTEAQAADYFQNPDKIVGHFAKVKTMTYGVKDLPRFPTFETLRLKEDM
jgi:DNA ligase-1